MMVADGSKKGKADPAFPAHIDVVQHRALAVWNFWLPVESLQQSLNYATVRTSQSPQPWRVVTGPAAALPSRQPRASRSPAASPQLALAARSSMLRSERMPAMAKAAAPVPHTAARPPVRVCVRVWSCV